MPRTQHPYSPSSQGAVQRVEGGISGRQSRPDREDPNVRVIEMEDVRAGYRSEEAKASLFDTIKTDNELALTSSEKARVEMSEEAVAACGIELDEAALSASLNGQQPPVKGIQGIVGRKGRKVRPIKEPLDFFSDMRNYPELLIELSKHLRVKELISLYAISKDFHGAIDGHLSHCMRVCAEYNAPESAVVFIFTFYDSLCIPDPAGRRQPRQPDHVRKAPSLRWLQMVVHKEKVIRDILACMARQGHRMPNGMSLSLKKMWLLMEIATTAHRVQFMQSNIFTDLDLYHIQMFIVKLDMRFNDPVDGPGEETMRKIFLGQKGLSPLWKLLKRTAFTDAMEVIKLGIRYAYNVRQEHRGMPLWDIPAHEIGIGHLEGWGAGRIHLARPDELVVREAVRRRLDLKNHVMGMMLWGYVDPITGKNIQVTDEETYMSDDEETRRL